MDAWQNNSMLVYGGIALAVLVVIVLICALFYSASQPPPPPTPVYEEPVIINPMRTDDPPPNFSQNNPPPIYDLPQANFDRDNYQDRVINDYHDYRGDNTGRHSGDVIIPGNDDYRSHEYTSRRRTENLQEHRGRPSQHRVQDSRDSHEDHRNTRSGNSWSVSDDTNHDNGASLSELTALLSDNSTSDEESQLSLADSKPVDKRRTCIPREIPVNRNLSGSTDESSLTAISSRSVSRKSKNSASDDFTDDESESQDVRPPRAGISLDYEDHSVDSTNLASFSSDFTRADNDDSTL